MKPLDLTFRSLRHHWRMNVAVACGVAVATAILTGALLVGDSMQGSLRQLTLDRLGHIDFILLSDRFFRQELAAELAQAEGFAADLHSAVPAIVLPQISSQATVDDPTTGVGRVTRVGKVTLIATDPGFWELDQKNVRPRAYPEGNQVVLNAPLAEALGVTVGDTVVLRLPKSNQVPADSPLGRRSGRVRGLANLEVVDIVPAEGLGRFSLHPTQQLPRNAFVSLNRIQRALDQKSRANSIFVAAGDPKLAHSADGPRRLAERLNPQLADYGYSVHRHRLPFKGANDKVASDDAANDEEGVEPEIVYDYVQVTSDRMVFEPAASRIALRALSEFNPSASLTYLANSIAKVGTEDVPPLPYSIVTAISASEALGDRLSEPLADGKVFLNTWSAEQLQAKVGDQIKLSFFAPETTHGEVREETAEFPVGGIVRLTEPAKGYTRHDPASFDQRPTWANDPHFTPTVEGITDRASIDDWDPPFPFDGRLIKERDDLYWENHRTTPKAFVSLATGQRLWASRFGNITSVRVPMQEGVDVNSVSSRLRDAFHLLQADMGFRFLPIKRDGLRAATGTTPFGMLFLGFSFFVIVAAVILVALLFRLGIELRAREIGTLLAVGWSVGQVRGCWLVESVIVAGLGGVLGCVLGVGYASLMLAGLRTWWLDAVVTPFLLLHVSVSSLAIGVIVSLTVCLLVNFRSLSGMRSVPVRQLLGGQFNVPRDCRREGGGSLVAAIPWLLILSAFGLAFLATRLNNEARAGSFLGSGFATLAAMLLWIFNRLRLFGITEEGRGRIQLATLAFQSAARNPLRSGLTIGLMAIACFLIVAIAAFRLQPTSEGTGGFDLIAQTDRSLFDVNTEEGRRELLGNDASQLDGATIVAMRWHRGEDASCRNLFQSARPQLLGVPASFVELARRDKEAATFAFAGPTVGNAEERADAWAKLFEKSDDGVVPTILDKNTALYALHLSGRLGEEFEVDYDGSRPIRFRVVGLLANSVLQGRLLVAEEPLLRYFPLISGYQYFLIRSPQGRSAAIATFLEQRLSDEGFDAEDAQQQLGELLNVQNTYLSTFQSLGGLGLLLGTLGLAVVQMRSIVERRGELALLRSVGFSRRRISALVTREQMMLLLAGLICGVLAALVAIVPHLLLGAASIPWTQLVVTLVVITIVGVLTSLWSVRIALKSPILQMLRGE